MILEQNLKFLSKKLKEILYKEVEESLIEYILTKDNIKVPFYKKVSIHSLYNPFRENVNIKAEKNTLIISLGFGAGYHLIKLIKKYKEIIVIVFEFRIFKSVISNIDLNLFFKEESLKIITIEEILDYYDFFKYDSYCILYPLSYERLFSGILLENIRRLKSTLNEKIVDINIQKKFGKIWHKNILKNLKRIDNFDYTPLIINKAILITGAGFSLIKNIELIKKFRNSFYIAATDTSLKILDYYGIIPDSVFTFDSQNFTNQHFLALKSYNFRLFMDITNNINNSNIKSITLLLSNHPFREFFKDNPLLYINSTSGNIGIAMIDFFYKYFNSIPIITVGIDYGIYKNIMYPRLSSITIYHNTISNFFKTTEYFDSFILYHYNIIEKNNEWCTNILFKSYNDFCRALPFCKNIYTLSDSPFTGFTKIDNLKNFIDKIEIKEKKLELKKIEFREDIHFRVKKFFFENPQTLLPYFISIRKKANESDIKDLIERSVSLLK